MKKYIITEDMLKLLLTACVNDGSFNHIFNSEDEQQLALENQKSVDRQLRFASVHLEQTESSCQGITHIIRR